MALKIINGPPGEAWTNDTPKILWQFSCSFQNSCGICIQFAGQIGTYWPIPLHYSCNCRNVSVRPGQQAAPFVDYQAEVRALDPKQQARVMGVSNWRMVDSGLVKWEDVVTKARIRDFREVVAEKDLTVKQMVGSGVSRFQATKAHGSVHTAAHEVVRETRSALIKALKGHGVSDDRIISELSDALASRISVSRGPGTNPVLHLGGFPKVPPIAPKLEIPAVYKVEKPGVMTVNPKLTNAEIDTLKESQPTAVPKLVTITRSVRLDAIDRLREWAKSDKVSADRVRSILEADEVPPVILDSDDDGNLGVMDGWYRIAAFVAAGRDKILGYLIGK